MRYPPLATCSRQVRQVAARPARNTTAAAPVMFGGADSARGVRAGAGPGHASTDAPQGGALTKSQKRRRRDKSRHAGRAFDAGVSCGRTDETKRVLTILSAAGAQKELVDELQQQVTRALMEDSAADSVVAPHAFAVARSASMATQNRLSHAHSSAEALAARRSVVRQAEAGGVAAAPEQSACTVCGVVTTDACSCCERRYCGACTARYAASSASRRVG
eukprot:958734-Prymnesium_polylepis.1